MSQVPVVGEHPWLRRLRAATQAPQADSRATKAALPITAALVCFVFGVIIRIWILRSPLGDADADEAVTGLVARHLLDGEFRAFYWGQAYAGTFEPLLTALVFALVGPSTVALKSVPIVLSFLGAALLWRAARDYFGSAYGPLEAGIYWVFPAASVVILMKAQVMYASGACFTLLLVLLTLRMRTDPRPWLFVAFGFTAGLALWGTPLSLATAVPISVVALAWTWRRPLLVLLAVPAAVLGALPWLWHSVTNDWDTLHQIPTIATTYGSRVKGCWLELYPLLLGMRKPITQEWVLGSVVGPVVFAVVLFALFAVPAYRLRTNALPLLAPVATFPFLSSLSETSWYTAEPRYGMLVAPLLVLLAVSLVPRTRLAQIAAFAVAVVMTASALGHVRDLGDRIPGLATIRPGELAPLIASMDRQGLQSCYGDYWIAYRVSFESDERIICAPLSPDRFPTYTDFAAQNGARTYLMLAGTPSAAEFGNRLTELGIAYRVEPFDTVDMFVLEEPKQPAELNA